MSRSTTHPPKIAFGVPSSEAQINGLTFYCGTCTHWLFRWFNSEFMPSIGELSEGWSAGCRLKSSHNPLSCSGKHDLIVKGPAPKALLNWFDADQPDWPKAPEDFVDGGAL